MLKAGMFVKIYQKPITQEDYEGIGRVQKVISQDKESARLLVKFRDEDGVYPRTVFAPFEVVAKDRSGF